MKVIPGKRKITVFALLCLAACFLFSACTAKPQQKSAQDIFYESIASVVELSCEGSGKNGTGFVWKSEDGYLYILTNKHNFVSDYNALKLEADITTYSSSGKRNAKSRATLLGFDSYHDVALLRTESPVSAGKALALRAERDFMFGEAAYVIGNAEGEGLSYYDGIISMPEQIIAFEDDYQKKNVPVTQASAPMYRGSSGCPVFDSDGKVAGIGTYQRGDAAGLPKDLMNYFVPSAIAGGIAMQIYSENKSAANLPVEINKLDITLEKKADDLRYGYCFDFGPLKFSAAITDEGLKVLSAVGNDSVTAGGGFITGDTVLAVNGQSLSGAGLFDIFRIFGRYLVSDPGRIYTVEKYLTLSVREDSGRKKTVSFLHAAEKKSYF